MEFSVFLMILKERNRKINNLNKLISMRDEEPKEMRTKGKVALYWLDVALDVDIDERFNQAGKAINDMLHVEY